MGRDNHGFQAINLLEFIGFGISRPGHAGQLAVHAEIVLESDRGQGLVLGLDLHAFLGFNRLMQTIGPAATGHQATGELVNNDHFAVLHDILLILLEQRQGAQRCIEVMHQRDVGSFVKTTPFLQQTVFKQQPLGMLIAGFGKMDLMAFLIDPVIALAVFFSRPRQ